MDHKKLSLSSLVVAAILFLFPWFEITCDEKPVATQSGFQTMTGGMSASDDFKEMGDEKTKEGEDDLDGSFMVVLAFLAVMGGIACYGSTLLGKKKLDTWAPKLALAAFGLVFFQWLIGFPLADQMDEFEEKTGKEFSANPGLEMAKAFKPELHTRFWLFLTMIAMAGGASAQVTAWGRKGKRMIDEKRKPATPPASP